MKKQIKERLSLRIMIIVGVLIAAIVVSCRKQAGTCPEKIQVPVIIYTDINPDSSMNGNGTYNLGLDNDGIYDFNFNAFSVSVKCDTPNPVMGTVDGTHVTIPDGSNNGIVLN
jgi:hypothetical protein